MSANSILARMAVVIEGQTADFNKKISEASSQLNKFSGNITSFAKTAVAGFGALTVASDIIKTTGEFQRFEAVLSNTLGSNSAAQNALKQIKDFAASTPFEVNELTAAYVKLANQGFTPTVVQLRKLGDLASSTGKSFDQLAEAVLDAQTGEFERLKEFGIKAKKSGDDVTFTFKGVSTTVKNTSATIRDYILSLGDAQGVTGSMDKISATLEGRISNLGDAWSNLLLVIGSGNKGVLFESVASLTAIVNALGNFKEELELKAYVYGFKEFNNLSKETLDYLLKFGKTNSGKALSEAIAPITSQTNQQFFENANANLNAFVDLLLKEGENVGEATTLWQRYLQTRLESAKLDNEGARDARLKAVLAEVAAAKLRFEAQNNQVETIKTLEEKLKSYQEEVSNTSTADLGAIGTLNKKSKALKEQIDYLKALVPLSRAALSNDPIVDKTTNKANQFPTIAPVNTNAKDRIVRDLIDINRAFEKSKTFGKSWADAAGIAFDQVAAKTISLNSSIAQGLAGFADALGQAAAGVGNFGTSILTAIAGFMRSFGEQLIALGIAAAAADVLVENPYTAVAAGIALVALAGAATASVAKTQRGITGKGGGSGAAITNATSFDSRSNTNINLSGELTVQNGSLGIALSNENIRTRRLG